MTVYNNNTKYWSMTWETNILQKTIPDEHEVLRFLRKHFSDVIFQYEKGTLKEKIHIQGKITYAGPRTSKTALLSLFKKKFENTGGLTLSPVRSKEGLEDYVMKEEGRVKGPFFIGNTYIKQQYSMKQSKLRTWQQDLYQILLSDKLPEYKDRKVIWVEDTGGNTGKSYFQKWLRLGQTELIVRPLAISNVDRLKAAVYTIHKVVNVDIYTINFTRTKGEGESYKDIFHAVEDIKDGAVIDNMYGKYNEAYFEPPVVIIFTNNPLIDAINSSLDFSHYLSDDRWVHYKIIKNELYELTRKGTPCLTKVNKKVDNKVENRAAENNSIEY